MKGRFVCSMTSYKLKVSDTFVNQAQKTSWLLCAFPFMSFILLTTAGV